jgi:hypothetical protein
MSDKPLGRKSYGSIAHLPCSRMGPADRKISEGQAIIATLKKRDKHDKIIVQEKLDGSNVGIAKIDGEIIPLVRAGYRADSSPYDMHHKFHDWVILNQDRFSSILGEGERICGEWLIQAHGTIYNLPHEPFVAFDFMSNENVRYPYITMVDMVHGEFVMPKLLSIGDSFTVDSAMNMLGSFGFHGALEYVEGAVWRVERKGAVDFLCKYVRPDKVDGKYLSGENVMNTWIDNG